MLDAVSRLNIVNWHVLGAVMWCEGSAGLRSSSCYQGGLSEHESASPWSWHCWVFAAREARLWLWEVQGSFFFSLVISAAPRMLLRGKSPYKGLWEEDGGSLLRAGTFCCFTGVSLRAKAHGPCGTTPPHRGSGRCRPHVFTLGILLQWKPWLLLAADNMQDGLAGLT